MYPYFPICKSFGGLIWYAPTPHIVNIWVWVAINIIATYAMTERATVCRILMHCWQAIIRSCLWCWSTWCGSDRTSDEPGEEHGWLHKDWDAWWNIKEFTNHIRIIITSIIPKTAHRETTPILISHKSSHITHHIDTIVDVCNGCNAAHDQECCQLQSGKCDCNSHSYSKWQQQPIQELTSCATHLGDNQPALHNMKRELGNV